MGVCPRNLMGMSTRMELLCCIPENGYATLDDLRVDLSVDQHGLDRLLDHLQATYDQPEVFESPEGAAVRWKAGGRTDARQDAEDYWGRVHTTAEDLWKCHAHYGKGYRFGGKPYKHRVK